MEKISSERTRGRAASSSSSSSPRKIDRIEEKVAAGKFRKFMKMELPKPPPDPRIVEMLPDERVVSSPKTAAALIANEPAPCVDDAFDHLEKLHAMMEEILDMRERNGKLFRRVRDLERARVTRKAHREAERLLKAGQDIVLPDEDVGFAESLLGAMLSSSFQLSGSRNGIGRVSGTARLTRSRSIGIEQRRVSCPMSIIDANNRQRRGNFNRGSPRCPETMTMKIKRPSLAIGTPKVSKWTRVKAAFKWERAACTNNDATGEPEAGIRYLKIPENSGVTSEVSGPPTPAGTISSSSSIDDVFHRPQRPSSNQSTRITRRDEGSDPSRRSRSLDGDASVPMNFVYSPRPRSKDNHHCLQGKIIDPRIHKTPWGKVKDMMQLRRESIGRMPARSISRNDDARSTSSLDSSDIHRSEQQQQQQQQQQHQIDGKLSRARIIGESNTINATNISRSCTSNVSNDFVDLATRRLTPTLTITVPSSEELRNISSPESITPSTASPRQSYESGKTERYSQQIGYDNAKETRTGQVSSASSSSGILRYGLGRSKTCQGVPYTGDYKRQQSLKGESLGSSPKMQRRDSKWNKVKRAFLTSATSVPTSPNRISSYFFDDGDATGGSYSASASAEDLDNESAASPGVQAEIQRNYRLLHEKLGTEFYRKLAEWEILKSSNASHRDSSRTNARERESDNLRLLGEERLTPEFKKKLAEWKRINKANGETMTRVTSPGDNRTINRRRITDWQLWRSSSKPENKIEGPRLSEDFIKKMEEWKRIKSAGSRRGTEIDAVTIKPRPEGEEDNDDDDDDEEDEEEEEEEEEEEDEDAEEEDEEEENNEEADAEEDKERLLRTRLSEKRRKAWKSLEDEEFRSLERVLEALEMDRQTRLSKLQRIVGSQPHKTQEVLIHTSTGLYRFEGISRKFTRKLYEWEKSQGISPELSTFRLLDPLRYGVGSLRTRAIAIDATDDGAPRKTRNRSKSVGCVGTDCWRTKRDHEKTTIRRPCSLSLNDIDNIDARSCIIASSIPTIPDEEDTSEEIAMEDSEAEPEPEAVIVDIEDVIEETASPLRKYQPHQTPVYSVAGSETTSIAIPLGTVTARHEPSPVILIEPGEAYPLGARASSSNETRNEVFYAHENDEETIVNVTLPSSSTGNKQRQRSMAGVGEIERETREMTDDELSTMGNKKNDDSGIIRGEMEEEDDDDEDDDGPEAREDSNENWRMAPLIRVESDPRALVLGQRLPDDDDESFEESVITVHSKMRHSKKLLKTRRLTDTQVGYDWRTMNEPILKNVANEITEERDQATDENSHSEINDEFEDNPNVERIIINEDTLNKIVVPTASSSSALAMSGKLEDDEDSCGNAEDSSRMGRREAASVFVKTKRIVFSPFRREAKSKTMEECQETVNSDESNENFATNGANDPANAEINKSNSMPISMSGDPSRLAGKPRTAACARESKRPPLPKSPLLPRKDYGLSLTGDTSASMRTMMGRYSEKLEIDSRDHLGRSSSSNIGTASSTGSSCSDGSSPIWRTPLTVRKFPNRPDRYDVAKKALTKRRTSNDCCDRLCDHPSAVLSKSWSVDFSRQRTNLETRRERTTEPEFFASSSTFRGDLGRLDHAGNEVQTGQSSVRAMKIRRAKESFLSMGRIDDATGFEERSDAPDEPGSSGDNGPEDTTGRLNDEENFSMARMDIVKSASAGMINIDENSYGRLRVAGENDEVDPRDYRPCSNEQLRRAEIQKERTGRLARIANKFKRIRARRSKERDDSGMRTVLKLCRQSLLVDIATSNDSGKTGQDESTRSRAGGSEVTGQRRDYGERRNDDDSKL